MPCSIWTKRFKPFGNASFRVPVSFTLHSDSSRSPERYGPMFCLSVQKYPLCVLYIFFKPDHHADSFIRREWRSLFACNIPVDDIGYDLAASQFRSLSSHSKSPVYLFLLVSSVSTRMMSIPAHVGCYGWKPSVSCVFGQSGDGVGFRSS